MIEPDETPAFRSFDMHMYDHGPRPARGEPAQYVVDYCPDGTWPTVPQDFKKRQPPVDASTQEAE